MNAMAFEFNTKVFSIDGSYFYRDLPTGSIYHKMPFDEGIVVSLKLSSLQREFGIGEETNDGRLLKLVSDALRYVKYVASGDRIPSEIIDGTASWSVEDHHVERAKGQLSMNLARWVLGDDRKLDPRASFDEQLNDPVVKQALHRGLSQAAEAMGFAPDCHEKVLSSLGPVEI